MGKSIALLTAVGMNCSSLGYVSAVVDTTPPAKACTNRGSLSDGVSTLPSVRQKENSR